MKFEPSTRANEFSYYRANSGAFRVILVCASLLCAVVLVAVFITCCVLFSNSPRGLTAIILTGITIAVFTIPVCVAIIVYTNIPYSIVVDGCKIVLPNVCYIDVSDKTAPVLRVVSARSTTTNKYIVEPATLNGLYFRMGRGCCGIATIYLKAQIRTPKRMNNVYEQIMCIGFTSRCERLVTDLNSAVGELFIE